jgi:TRAP-type mannitol/chloroaromatic compound transport system substrate-binding protein
MSAFAPLLGEKQTSGGLLAATDFMSTHPSNDVVADIGSGDELSRKIYASYQQFRTTIKQWSDIAEHAFLKSRSLA